MSMAFLPEEDAATIPPEQARELVARGLLSPQQPGLNLAGPSTGGGGGGGDNNQVKLPDVVRKVVGTREEVRDGRRVRVTTYDDGTEDVEDLGPASPTGRKETGRREIVRDGRRIQVIEYDDGTTEETDLGPVQGDGKKVVSVNSIVVGGRRILRTSYDDGTFSDEDLGPETPDDTGDGNGTGDEDAAAAARAASEAAFRAQQRSDAFSRLRSLLSRFGLSELEGAVQNIITSGAVDLNDANAIIFSIRGEPAYRKRFAANEARAKKGLPELDPSTYIGLEEQYRTLLRANGLPLGFYDDLSDFQKLIEGDVSPQELQTRVQEGYRKVRDADPEVRRQMQQLYGVDDNGLAAYFLDPDKATPLLTTRARAAGIAARGAEQAAMQLTAAQAEELAARGITPEEAQARFMQRGLLSGLYNPMAGEEALTGQQELGAIFQYDPEAQKRLAERRAQRLGEFQAGGQFARTTGATSGTIETGAGLAQ